MKIRVSSNIYIRGVLMDYLQGLADRFPNIEFNTDNITGEETQTFEAAANLYPPNIFYEWLISEYKYRPVWMFNIEKYNLKNATLEQTKEAVKKRIRDENITV